nr:ATP-dependent zinc metalloprotease FtsH [Ligaoa zhengdingensis]
MAVNRKKSRGLGIYLLILIALVLGIFSVFTLGDTAEETPRYQEILAYFQNGEVKDYSINFGTGELIINLRPTPEEQQKYEEQLANLQQQGANAQQSGGLLSGLFGPAGQQAVPSGDEKKEAPGKQIIYRVPSVAYFVDDTEDMVAEYNEAHPDSPITFDYIRAKDVSPLVQWMPTLILIGVMVLFWFLMMRQAGGGAGKAMSFAKMKVKSDDGRKTTFADVAGADEEKEELKEVVEFLKDPRRFNELGARIPKGVLLVGPPGTGKTLLARAVAGEAGVPFFSISGSDFVEMFVGVGASRVRDLFEQAKKNAPAIVFIDEIDAVGRQRGAGLGGGHDEREQTLNQLLVEMDGFGANSGVIVIAATNRADILDKALLRPGRFDRQIYVGYPDVEGREAILKVHTRGKPLGPDVNLRTIAQTTVGFTGADLENLANEAALLAARRGKKAITMQEIEEATIKVIAGPEKKSRKVSEKDKKLTAYHEAGHAIAHYSLPGQDPVHQVSIIPRGMAGGYTMSLPVEDESYRSKKWMQENIVTLLGGRVAEKLVLDDISTGASNDIQRATKMARDMVTRYGFSEKLGPIVYGTDDNEVFLGRDFGQARNYSENVAAEIDSEVREIIDNAYEQCKDILTEHMAELHKVAKYLYRYEKIDGDVFRRLMEDPNFPDEAHEQEMEEREERERRIEERAKKNTEEILAKKVEPNVPQDDEDKE